MHLVWDDLKREPLYRKVSLATIGASTKYTESSPRVILAGGGTGGHLFPALAIATEFHRRHPNAELLFVGAQDKIEMEKVPKEGYPIEGLWISGFHRQLTMRNLLFPIKLASSLVKSWKIVRRFRPDVVVGTGGFASGPVLQIATMRGIPTLIQEQNSYPGVTNRLLAKRVDVICAAYDNVKRYFPPHKIVFAGNPVRHRIRREEVSRETAAAHFGLDPGRPVVFLFGGSLGAKSMNEAVRANADVLRQHPEVQLLWQAGKLYVDEFGNCATALLPNVRITAFIDRMDLAYRVADVVIARGGAGTISELSHIGKPAILIPSPNVAEDHQTENVRELVAKSAAILLPDREAEEMIIRKALEVLNDEALQRQLSTNIRRLNRPDAVKVIVDEVEKLAGLRS